MTVPLAYQEFGPEGSGTGDDVPPLVIAHGVFGSSRNLQTLAQRLAANRRVFVVDMRNHGESPWAGSMEYKDMAEDLARFVEEHAGGRSVILGHSMGGKAAMALALSRPELVAGLIVADIAPVASAESLVGYVHAMHALDLSAISRRSEADTLLAKTVPQPMLRAFFLQSLAIENGKPRWRLNLPALEAGMDAIIGWPKDYSGRTYAGPSLFIYGGASDHEVGKAEPEIRKLFSEAELQEIEGAGHWLHAEKPDEFAAAVERWLARL